MVEIIILLVIVGNIDKYLYCKQYRYKFKSINLFLTKEYKLLKLKYKNYMSFLLKKSLEVGNKLIKNPSMALL